MGEGGGKSPPKDEKGLKEWIKNKLKTLSSLLGRLGVKAAEALPGDSAHDTLDIGCLFYCS